MLKLEVQTQARADVFLRDLLQGPGRRLIQKLFQNHAIKRRGHILTKGDLVFPGDVIAIEIEQDIATLFHPLPEDLPLNIVFEDDDFIAINKPPGMASHPLHPGEKGSVANRLVAKWPTIAGIGADPREAGLAHRLDQGTSGVLLACRNQNAWTTLREHFGKGLVSKTYIALVETPPRKRVVDTPLEQRGAKSMTSENGLPAQTEITDVTPCGTYYTLRCVAHSGRMHQIRAHLASIGSPLIGDALYGGLLLTGLTHHLLHASEISLGHPISKENISINAPLPESPFWFA